MPSLPASQLSAPFAPPDPASMWAMYRRVLVRAELAAAEVREVLREGVLPTPKVPPYLAEPSIALDRITRLIDRHVACQFALREAAQTLVDCLELADGGRAEGVRWSVDVTAMRVPAEKAPS